MTEMAVLGRVSVYAKTTFGECRGRHISEAAMYGVHLRVASTEPLQ